MKYNISYKYNEEDKQINFGTYYFVPYHHKYDENYNENDPNTNIMFDVLTDLLVTDDIYINVNIVTTLINFSNLQLWQHTYQE